MPRNKLQPLVPDDWKLTEGRARVATEIVRPQTLADRSVAAVAREAAARNQPLRIRVSLALLDLASQSYKGWRGMVWKINVKDKDGAEELAIAMEAFFDVVEAGGARYAASELKDVLGYLDEWQRRNEPRSSSSEPGAVDEAHSTAS